MIADHTVKSYDQEITHLTRKILEMGGLVEDQVSRSIEALVDGNVDLADQVVERDDAVDTLEEEIDQFAIRMLATRQPVAVDLRLIAMAMKISNDLERIGDYAAKGIAARCHRLAKEPARRAAAACHPAHGRARAGHGEGRARCLRPARCRQGG